MDDMDIELPEGMSSSEEISLEMPPGVTNMLSIQQLLDNAGDDMFDESEDEIEEGEEEEEEEAINNYEDDDQQVNEIDRLRAEIEMGGEIEEMSIEEDVDGYMDEYDAPKLFDVSNYAKEFQVLATKINGFGLWLHKQLERFERKEDLSLSEYRFDHVYASWVNYLVIHDSLMRETKNLPTFEDRSILVAYGANIFANIFQLHVLKTVRKISEARGELRERYMREEIEEEKKKEKEKEEEEERQNGNNLNEYDYETIQDETEGIRLYKFRVSHLGIWCSHWISSLSEEVYEKDQEFQRMTEEEWHAHVKREEGEDLWKRRKKAPPPYKAKEQVKLPKHKSVMQFRQSEVVRALKLMTKDLNKIRPSPALRDFFQVLMWRNGLFFCKNHPKSVLDVPHFRAMRKDEDGADTYLFNRNYMFFSYFYCWSVMKRWYFFDLYCGEEQAFIPRFRINQRMENSDIRWILANQSKRTDERFMNRTLLTDTVGVTDEEVVMVKSWIQNTLFPCLGSEGFNMLYEHTMEEAYRFPGDIEFFKIIEPRRPTNTATILAYTRQEDENTRESFIEEMKVTMANIVRAVGANYTNDIFILDAIDSYFRSYISNEIRWRDTFVIDADWIEQSAFVICNLDRPMLIQLFSSYWIIFETRVYKTKSTLEAITLWFKMMDRWFVGAMEWEIKDRGKFVVTSSIKKLLDQIWRPEPKYNDLGDGIHDKPLP